MTLLSFNDRKRLHTYQYSGGDSSPVYKYVLSPFAQFCVDNFIPKFVAPNVVTSLGLIASAVSLGFTLYFDPLLLGKGPRWLYLLSGACVFAYQTFDNMDGKQARRTGSSSALGMLFDHGCDAINAGLMCIPMGAVAATGWSTKLFLCICSGFVPFYFQTWEEYYTGTMVLPSFNGPTEGLLMAVGMCVISYFKGPEWWQQVYSSCISSLSFLPLSPMQTSRDYLTYKYC
jgi:ethanolaminephosphotransferase